MFSSYFLIDNWYFLEWVLVWFIYNNNLIFFLSIYSSTAVNNVSSTSLTQTPGNIKILKTHIRQPTTNVYFNKNDVVAGNASHIGQVCSTWGNYHWKTFDGHLYRLVSSCNHVVVSECNEEGFNIQMKRSLVNGIPKNTFVFAIEGTMVELSRRGVTVDQNT